MLLLSLSVLGCMLHLIVVHRDNIEAVLKPLAIRNYPLREIPEIMYENYLLNVFNEREKHEL